MSYQEALQAAGATVAQFETFGSYQGDWLAIVTYEGRTGWIKGSFGSCSVCDSFEAEFGYERDSCKDHRHSPEVGCEACAEATESYQSKLAEFGREYLGSIMTQEEAEKAVSEYLEWDSGAKDMLEFVRKHAAEVKS